MTSTGTGDGDKILREWGLLLYKSQRNPSFPRFNPYFVVLLPVLISFVFLFH